MKRVFVGIFERVLMLILLKDYLASLPEIHKFKIIMYIYGIHIFVVYL